MDVFNYSRRDLEGFNYRDLQKIAKRMNLPSNVKKSHLINMIHSKHYGTEFEFNQIVNSVKEDRKLMSTKKKNLKRKIHLQGKEISTTSSYSSPVIKTPKAHFVINYSPNLKHTYVKYVPRHNNFNHKQNRIPCTNYLQVDGRFGHSDQFMRKSSAPYPRLRAEISTICSTNIKSEIDVNHSFVKKSLVEMESNFDLKNEDISHSTPVKSKKISELEKNLTRNNLIRSYTSPRKTVISTTGSDRVLRSFVVKPSKNPIFRNYYMGDEDHFKKSLIEKSSTKCKVVLEKTIVRKSHANINLMNDGSEKTSDPVSTTTGSTQTSPLPAKKRKRTVSGIYPLSPKENNQDNPDMIQSSIGIIKDGKYSIKTAFVRKNLNDSDQANNNDKSIKNNESQNVTATVQELITKSIDSHLVFTSNQNIGYNKTSTNNYSNETTTNQTYMANYQDFIANQMNNASNQNVSGYDQRSEMLLDAPVMHQDDNFYSVYYHKKIRAEHVRSQRKINYTRQASLNDDILPNINDVFSRFNDQRYNVSQPMYMQVDNDLCNYNPQLIGNRSQTPLSMLESLYNIKSTYLTHNPLASVTTTSNTKCVFSTSVVSTPMAESTQTVFSNDLHGIPSCAQGNYYPYQVNAENLSRAHDYARCSEQEYVFRKNFPSYEDANRSETDTTLSHDLSGTMTVPDNMVEDALEIISQDGDYMERIGLEVGTQCFWCSWAGPNIILEYHIRTNHPELIQRQSRADFNLTFLLRAALCRESWMCRVAEVAERGMYVLSAKCQLDLLSISLHTLIPEVEPPKIGSLTIFNKVTGEPFSWTGEILPAPPSLPFDNDSSGLKINIANLNLLPNSANLVFTNHGLVLTSANKVIQGKMDLHDIHVIVFIKIYEGSFFY